MCWRLSINIEHRDSADHVSLAKPITLREGVNASRHTITNQCAHFQWDSTNSRNVNPVERISFRNDVLINNHILRMSFRQPATVGIDLDARSRLYE